jgi:hypothetical protein
MAPANHCSPRPLNLIASSNRAILVLPSTVNGIVFDRALFLQSNRGTSRILGVLEPLWPAPIVLDGMFKAFSTQLAVNHERNRFRLGLQEARNSAPALRGRRYAQVDLATALAIEIPAMILIELYRGISALVIKIDFVQ